MPGSLLLLVKTNLIVVFSDDIFRGFPSGPHEHTASRTMWPPTHSSLASSPLLLRWEPLLDPLPQVCRLEILRCSVGAPDPVEPIWLSYLIEAYIC
jgi:hypothetical protein